MVSNERPSYKKIERRSEALVFGVWASLPAATGTIFSVLEVLNDNSALAARAEIATVLCSAFMGIVGLFLSNDAARDFLMDRRDRRARRR